MRESDPCNSPACDWPAMRAIVYYSICRGAQRKSSWRRWLARRWRRRTLWARQGENKVRLYMWPLTYRAGYTRLALTRQGVPGSPLTRLLSRLRVARALRPAFFLANKESKLQVFIAVNHQINKICRKFSQWITHKTNSRPCQWS